MLLVGLIKVEEDGQAEHGESADGKVDVEAPSSC